MVNFVFQTDSPDCGVGIDHKHSRQVRRLVVSHLRDGGSLVWVNDSRGSGYGEKSRQI